MGQLDMKQNSEKLPDITFLPDVGLGFPHCPCDLDYTVLPKGYETWDEQALLRGISARLWLSHESTVKSVQHKDPAEKAALLKKAKAYKRDAEKLIDVYERMTGTVYRRKYTAKEIGDLIGKRQIVVSKWLERGAPGTVGVTIGFYRQYGLLMGPTLHNHPLNFKKFRRTDKRPMPGANHPGNYDAWSGKLEFMTVIRN